MRVRFHPAPGWKIATQMVPTEDANVFTARDLQYFMDSPVELSAWDARSWTVADGAKRYGIRLTVHHDGTPADLDRFAAMAQKVVAQQIAVFGAPPPSTMAPTPSWPITCRRSAVTAWSIATPR